MSGQKELLIEKLQGLEARYEQLEKELSEAAEQGDSARMVSISKEQGKLRPQVTKYRDYKKATADLEQAEHILADKCAEGDFKELARQESEELRKRQDSLLEEMEGMLVMGDDMEIGSVIMEIRAGTGGEEAALFARDLHNMYVKYAEGRRWAVENLDFSPTDRGGFREVIFSIKGPGVWSHLGYEGGVHRVQRVPETEAQGRVHTSAATVAVLPEPEEVDIQINPNDVVEHVSRAGGPGGQNVNKVSSAIRLEHKPTGITVNMREDKSQHKNRAKAWRLLRSRIYEHYQSQKSAQRLQQRKKMIGSGDRSEKIRTYNFPQNRLTDHRINLSIYTLDKILAGDMGDVVAALQNYDRQERLKNL